MHDDSADDPLTPPSKLAELFAALGLPDERTVLNCYCGGSRLWGTSSASSDYDIYIVHTSKEPSLRVKTVTVQRPLKCDATLLYVDEWKERLDTHKPDLLVFNWHPRPWLERRGAADAGWTLSKQKLADCVREQTQREWQRVRKYFGRAERPLGKSTLLHLLRIHMLAAQLVEHGRVVDFHAARALHAEIQEQYSTDLAWWEAEYGPRLLATQRALDEAAAAVAAAPRQQ